MGLRCRRGHLRGYAPGVQGPGLWHPSHHIRPVACSGAGSLPARGLATPLAFGMARRDPPDGPSTAGLPHSSPFCDRHPPRLVALRARVLKARADLCERLARAAGPRCRLGAESAGLLWPLHLAGARLGLRVARARAGRIDRALARWFPRAARLDRRLPRLAPARSPGPDRGGAPAGPGEVAGGRPSCACAAGGLAGDKPAIPARQLPGGHDRQAPLLHNAAHRGVLRDSPVEPGQPPQVECPPSGPLPGRVLVAGAGLLGRPPREGRRLRTTLTNLRRTLATIARGLTQPRLYLLLLLSLATWSLAYQYKTTYTIDVGGLHDDAFVFGFNAKERNASLDYRWSGPKSSIRLPGIGNEPVLVTITTVGNR